MLGNDYGVIVNPQAMPAVHWDAPQIEKQMRFNFNDDLSGPDEVGIE